MVTLSPQQNAVKLNLLESLQTKRFGVLKAGIRSGKTTIGIEVARCYYEVFVFVPGGDDYLYRKSLSNSFVNFGFPSAERKSPSSLIVFDDCFTQPNAFDNFVHFHSEGWNVLALGSIGDYYYKGWPLIQAQSYATWELNPRIRKADADVAPDNIRKQYEAF